MASKRWKGATRVTQRQFETTDEYVCFLRAFKKRDWSFIFSGVFVIICQLEGGSKENHYERKEDSRETTAVERSECIGATGGKG